MANGKRADRTATRLSSFFSKPLGFLELNLRQTNLLSSILHIGKIGMKGGEVSLEKQILAILLGWLTIVGCLA